MIYVLLIVSFLVFLYLKTNQYRFEFFSDQPKPPRFWQPIKKAVWSYYKKKAFVKIPVVSSYRFEIIKSLATFTGIFTIGAFVFAILQYWLEHTSEIEFASATVLNIEQTQVKIQSFAKKFKLDFANEMLVIFLLIALATSIPLIEKLKMLKKFGAYMKIIKMILSVLFITTSFTFFGQKLDENAKIINGTLELHRLSIINENKLLLADIRQDIEREVINTIIENENMISVLDDIESLEYDVNADYSDDDYSLYMNHHLPSLQVSNFTRFLSTVSGKYNYEKGLEELSRACGEEMNVGEKQYAGFKKRNQSWYSESKLSDKEIHVSKENYAGTRSSWFKSTSKYYEKFREPLTKLIKKAYGETGKKWVKGVCENIGISFPFADELIDPVIHAPVQDYIIKKTDRVFKYAKDGNVDLVKNEMQVIKDEVSEMTKKEVERSAGFAVFQNEVKMDKIQFMNLQNSIHQQLEIEKKLARSYLKEISRSNNWEKIRRDYLFDLKKNILRLTPEQKVILTELEKWSMFLDNSCFKIYLNKETNLENVFIEYSNANADARWMWNHIVEEKFNLVKIYHPVPVTGISTGGLEYYFSNMVNPPVKFEDYITSNNMLSQIDDVTPGKVPSYKPPVKINPKPVIQPSKYSKPASRWWRWLRR